MRQYLYEQYKWNDVSADQKRLFESIELDFIPLMKLNSILAESELTDGQIEKIFSNAEKISREGNLKTPFGKMVSLPKDSLYKINSVLAKFGTRLQQSTPVAGFDQKFAQLQEKLKTELGKTPAGQKALAMVETLGQAAKEHPIWQAAIIGILTAMSGLALGPGSIPVMAAVLKGATELVKGEKFSTAIGKGVYAGALGYLGASVAHGLSSWFEHIRLGNITPVGPSDLGFEKISFQGSSTAPPVNGMQWTRWFKIADATVDPTMRSAINNAILKMGAGDLSAYDELLGIAKKVAAPEYLQGLRDQVSTATANKISNDAFLKSIKQIGKFATAAMGGAGAGVASGTSDNTSSSRIPRPVMEGMWADLTLQFGAGKLMKAWNAMGRPTDSVEIARMMADMGMNAANIRYLFLKSGLSQDDVDATMTAMHNDAEEVTVPFKSGIEQYDNEAKRIFKTQGEEAFVVYWENKAREIEQQIKALEPAQPAVAPAPVAPPETPEEPPTPDNQPGDEQGAAPGQPPAQGPGQGEVAITSSSDIGKELLNKMKTALKSRDVESIRNILPNQKISEVLRNKLIKLINDSALNKKEKAKAATALKRAIILPTNTVQETFNLALKSMGMTIHDLGYNNELKAGNIRLIL